MSSQTERTPEDWFSFWLNGPSDDDFLVVKTEPYDVWMEPLSGDMVINLPLRLCPKCHGSGSYRQSPRLGPISLYRDSAVSITEKVQIETVQCDHKSSHIENKKLST